MEATATAIATTPELTVEQSTKANEMYRAVKKRGRELRKAEAKTKRVRAEFDALVAEDPVDDRKNYRRFMELSSKMQDSMKNAMDLRATYEAEIDALGELLGYVSEASTETVGSDAETETVDLTNA